MPESRDAHSWDEPYKDEQKCSLAQARDTPQGNGTVLSNTPRTQGRGGRILRVLLGAGVQGCWVWEWPEWTEGHWRQDFTQYLLAWSFWKGDPPSDSPATSDSPGTLVKNTDAWAPPQTYGVSISDQSLEPCVLTSSPEVSVHPEVWCMWTSMHSRQWVGKAVPVRTAGQTAPLSRHTNSWTEDFFYLGVLFFVTLGHTQINNKVERKTTKRIFGRWDIRVPRNNKDQLVVGTSCLVPTTKTAPVFLTLRSTLH